MHAKKFLAAFLALSMTAAPQAISFWHQQKMRSVQENSDDAPKESLTKNRLKNAR